MILVYFQNFFHCPVCVRKHCYYSDGTCRAGESPGAGGLLSAGLLAHPWTATSDMLCWSEYHGDRRPIVMLQGSGSGLLAVNCDITMLDCLLVSLTVYI